MVIFVLSIAGILFTILSILKNKILIAFSIIKAAYSLPVAKLAFIRDKYTGLPIFGVLKNDMTIENYENFFTYLQIIGASKLEAIEQLKQFSRQKSITPDVRRFLKNGMFTEQHIGNALYEFFTRNLDRLKVDPMIISLEEEYEIIMGGKSIFDTWTKSNPIRTMSQYKTKLNISFLIPATWEVIKDVKRSKKHRSSFHMRHGWHKLSEFKIFKKESVTNMKTHIEALKQNLAEDDAITLTESSEFDIPSKIHAHRFIYETKDELLSPTMDVYFSYLENLYHITFESFRKPDFLELLPEVEEIIRSIKVKSLQEQ